MSELGRDEEAIESVEKAVEINPDFTMVITDLKSLKELLKNKR